MSWPMRMPKGLPNPSKRALPPLSRSTRSFGIAGRDIAIKVDFAASEYGDVWEAGHELALYFEKKPELVQGQRVLEVGSGVGLVGIVCSLLGAEYTVLTDQAPLMACLERNVEVNGGPGAECQELDWDNRRQVERVAKKYAFDVIVGSDVVYEEEGIAPLLYVLRTVCSQSKQAGIDTVAFIAIKHRNTFVDIRATFFQEAAPCFKSEDVATCNQNLEDPTTPDNEGKVGIYRMQYIGK